MVVLTKRMAVLNWLHPLARTKNNLLMSSRHLSSSLGDSFCLLPAKRYVAFKPRALTWMLTLLTFARALEQRMASRLVRSMAGPRFELRWLRG